MPIQTPLATKLSPLANLSNAIFQYEQNSQLNEKQKQALVQASWHLSKCDLLYQTATQKKITPGRYLNVLSAFSFSAALCLEQIYRFHSPDISKSHNLIQLHNLIMEDVPMPEGVKTLHLAVIWTRYYIDQYPESTNMPPLLSTLLQLSTKARGFNLMGNLKKMNEEVCDSIHSIAPFLLKELKTHTMSSSVPVLDEIFMIESTMPLLSSTSLLLTKTGNLHLHAQSTLKQ